MSKILLAFVISILTSTTFAAELPKTVSCTWNDQVTKEDGDTLTRSFGVEIENPADRKGDQLVKKNVRSNLFKSVYADFIIEEGFLTEEPETQLTIIDEKTVNSDMIGDNSIVTLHANGNILLQANLVSVKLENGVKGAGRIQISCSVLK